jgi:pantetheine-phosphate adenylyltransferase
MNMKRAVYAGSFDPTSAGHIHVVQKAAATFDEVVVVVAHNSAKTGYFSVEDRVRFCKDAFSHIPNVKVDQVSDSYVVDYAERIGATHLVRGLPTVADFQYEYELYHNNRSINPKLDTVFVMCDKDVQQVRSSTVRGMVGYRGWVKRVKPLVPKTVFDALLLKHMEKEWMSLWPKMSQHCQPLFEMAWKHIADRMARRGYHNLEHIRSMLDGFADYEEKHGKMKDDRNVFMVAIWLHDIVVSSDESGPYPKDWPVSSTSWTPEEHSAEYARWLVSHCRFGKLPPEADFIHALILATDYSKPRERGDLQKLLCCLDCAVLASSKDDYAEYKCAVFNEYVPVCGMLAFTQGRHDFLKSVLENGSDIVKFFGHPDFAKFETQARINMERELWNIVEEAEE